MLRYLQKAFRAIAWPASFALAAALLPLKLLAYKTRIRILRRTILEITSFFDWAMVFANVQNPAMLLHFRLYRGNFFFGKALMVVDHATAVREIARPTLRGNRFMGIELVTNDPAAFVTNAGPITTAQPIRGLHRRYIDEQVMTAFVRGLDLESLRAYCEEILSDWKADPTMASAWSIRGAATRMFLRILTQKILPKQVTDEVTVTYTRRFVEFSLFGRYLPAMLWILGTREGIRRDAYIRLRRYGIGNVELDMTLFAAMFSVGTIVLRCLELAAEHRIDYRRLMPRERMQFVIEAQRLYPTVTSVHRIVEDAETVRVLGLAIQLGPGDEVAYPFACINRDATQFADPEAFRLDRPREEVERVLSWSTGPHACPAKELSILAIVVLLDSLAERFDLRELRVFNPEF